MKLTKLEKLLFVISLVAAIFGSIAATIFVPLLREAYNEYEAKQQKQAEDFTKACTAKGGIAVRVDGNWQCVK